MMVEQRLAFTGSGEQIFVETPPMDLTPTPRLTDSQRAQIRMLIAREHVGHETEMSALLRVIAKTEYDRRRYAGVLTRDGTSLGGLADQRLTKLYRYQREIEGDE